MTSICNVCFHSVSTKLANVRCTYCLRYYHIKCTSLDNCSGNYLAEHLSSWLCSKCLTLIFPFNHLDDDYFEFSIYELVNGPLNYDFDRLSTLQCNPLFSNFNIRTDLFQDLDPDINFFTPKTCDYFLIDQFNDLFTSAPCTDLPSLSLLHLNIRSLPRNLEQFTNLLSCLSLKFSMIGLSETWLTQNSSFTDIPGYNFINQNREGKAGGGVAIFLSDSLEFKMRDDLNFNNHDLFEALFIEVQIPHGKNIIAGVVYRPPNNNSDAFLAEYNKIISLISKENKLYYIMGDFNLNLLNSESHSPTGEFLDTMLSKMLFPLISKPSRITANTASLIDNIFTNDYAQIKCGLLFTDISDHFPVFSLSKSTSTSDSSENESNFIRNFKTANRTKFDAMLRNKDWTELYSLGDPNEAYNAFSKSLIEIYNNCFPLEKPSRRVSTSLRKP